VITVGKSAGVTNARAAIEISRRAAALLLAAPLVVALVGAAAYRARHADHLHVAEPPRELDPPKAALPLRLAPGQRHLVDHNAAPFLLVGDAGWSLVAQLRKEEAETYLEDRRRRGFNLIMANLIEHWFAERPPLDAYGTGPFAVPGDFGRPVDEYFDHAREIVRIASRKGMVILLCPAYLGGDGGQEGWYREMRANGPAKLEQYGRYVGRRFREFDNVIWLLGGDFTPPAADLGLVSAVARGIHEASPDQLLTAEWSPETSAFDVAAETALDINTTYTYQPAYLKGLVDYDHADRRPRFLIESQYEHERSSTQRSLRAQAYYALLTGAMGEIYGNGRVYGFVRPTIWKRLSGRDWMAELDSPGTRSMEFLRLLFEGLPWTTLVPDETYEVLLTGQGWKGSMNYPVLAWSRDGRLAVTYLPSGEAVTIDLRKLSAPVRARWFDPTNGSFSVVTGSPLAATAEHEFLPPAANASGDKDWVLVLEHES
jgi:hypothetical protein